MFESPLSSYTALDYLLAVLDIGVTHFTVCDIRKDWGIYFEDRKAAHLHYCLDGYGTLLIQGVTDIHLEPHTFVMLPPGLAYQVVSGTPKSVKLGHCSRLYREASHSATPMFTIGEGTPGITTASGELRVSLGGELDIFTSVSEPLVVRFDLASGLQDQFLMLLTESAQPGVGTHVLTDALIKQCLVLALRRRIECDGSPLPWLAGLTDIRLSRALHAIFEQPAKAYTVDGLAMTAGMSRSSFAAAFRRTFALSPMNFVKLVRLRRATELLISTTLPVAEIAKRVGFSSRANFSVAFSERHGMDPSRFRRSFSRSVEKNSE